MEYTKVNEQLKYVTASGSTLSCEERMQLEYAMSSLQSSMCFETLFFWGKISGKYFSVHRERQTKQSNCCDYVLHPSHAS